MSQHAASSCNESNGSWLPLIEYSIKSGLSLSTIRRKIKSNSISYRLEKGRYLILFNENAETHYETPEREEIPSEESLDFERSVKMVTDAFEFALKEKEARILALEKENSSLGEEVTELKLLVKVLEEKYQVRY